MSDIKQATEARDKAWDLMKSLDFCFVVSETSDGMRARPMSSIFVENDPKIYFISIATSEQVADIAALPNVLLNYGNGSNKFVSTNATATVSTDRALIKRLWNAGAQTFWPEGPEKADVCVICTTPEKAEYWDGPSGVVTLAKMAVSLVSGSRVELGENETVTL
jgi:general stress protein 26